MINQEPELPYLFFSSSACMDNTASSLLPLRLSLLSGPGAGFSMNPQPCSGRKTSRSRHFKASVELSLSLISPGLTMLDSVRTVESYAVGCALTFMEHPCSARKAIRRHKAIRYWLLLSVPAGLKDSLVASDSWSNLGGTQAQHAQRS